MEKIIKSETVFRGNILDVSVKTVELEDHTTSTREVVHTSGAVGVLAIDKDGRALFARQWRTPIEQETLEIIAGRREPDEPVLVTAQRELNEEGGVLAKSWEPLTTFFQSAGYADGQTTLFLATGIEALLKKRPQDVGEFVKIERLTLDEAKKAQEDGLICDAKTVMSLALWELWVKKHG